MNLYGKSKGTKTVSKFGSVLALWRKSSPSSRTFGRLATMNAFLSYNKNPRWERSMVQTFNDKSLNVESRKVESFNAESLNIETFNAENQKT
jgi:hypothetical protein